MKDDKEIGGENVSRIFIDGDIWRLFSTPEGILPSSFQSHSNKAAWCNIQEHSMRSRDEPECREGDLRATAERQKGRSPRGRCLDYQTHSCEAMIKRRESVARKKLSASG